MKSLRYSTVIAATIALTSAMSLQAQTTTPQRRVLMEEYTGTWCSNCPRGIASIEHLQKKYGDRFIAVAIHQDSYDPMKTKLYASGNGYPSCQLNRSINCDPFFGTDWDYSDPIGVIHDIDKLMKQTCYADVRATAQWKDNTHTQFKITKSFATTWKNLNQLSLTIQGQSLPRIYDNFVAQVSGIGEHKAGALAEIVELKKRIATMESELQSLEKRMRREPQYDVQVKMNKQVKAKRQELAGLKQKMEELSV